MMKFRDEEMRTMFRRWMCGWDGCDGEMKSSGRGMEFTYGTRWSHYCDKCGRIEEAPDTYPRIVHELAKELG